MILNIYTPLNTPPEKPLPVMFYIHGGGFLERSASRMIYGPEYLMSKGVVLVTINYRLNFQGFLCLGIKEAPGNVGMKDQVAALEWVKRNIRAFGGDPDNVTIFGESAGGVSVAMHVISPMSQGLFHKAITQSGSSLSGFALQYEPVHAASLLAKSMGFHSQEPRELYNFFAKQADADLILTEVPRPEGAIIWTDLLCPPCVEKDIGDERFLPDLPYNLLIKGNYTKVPMIIGTNKNEGLYIMSLDKEDLILKAKFSNALPADLSFPTNPILNKVADEINKLYMGGDELRKETKAKFSKIYGEPHFNYAALEETELLLRTTDKDIYHYLFVYEGSRNVIKKVLLGKGLKTVSGATHADELFYLFSQLWLPSLFETEMITKMTTMWTNFAKYG